jgi:hypothetical protein
MNHKRAERPRCSPVYVRVAAVVLCLFLLRPAPVPAAEPDWSQVEKQALEFLQQYIRIRSINPPADTREAAALIKTELESRWSSRDSVQTTGIAPVGRSSAGVSGRG